MRKFRFVVWLFVFLLFFAIMNSYAAQENTVDRKALLETIERLTQAKGEYIEKEGVFRVGFPRQDLKVNVSGINLPPAMGLGVWAGFKINGDKAMVMGDNVLTEEQVNPVLDAALSNGLEVTAIHNHFCWDSPKIMFMHISGTGELENLAVSVGKVFAQIRQPQGRRPEVKINPSNTTLDPKKIENITGVSGTMSGGVYKVTIGRTTSMNGENVGNAMGVNTWAAFAGSDESAVVDGDFVMLESEVTPVLKALRKAGINIVALHNHMMMESPRMMYLHFWGLGSTAELAKGLKEALDTQQK